jgi:hypothetical protein
MGHTQYSLRGSLRGSYRVQGALDVQLILPHPAHSRNGYFYLQIPFSLGF